MTVPIVHRKIYGKIQNRYFFNLTMKEKKEKKAESRDHGKNVFKKSRR